MNKPLIIFSGVFILIVRIKKIRVITKIGITAIAFCFSPAINIKASPPIIPQKGIANRGLIELKMFFMWFNLLDNCCFMKIL